MDREDFYSDYNNLILKCCQPYENFLETAVDSIPDGTESICELGIGTGNFSSLVRNRFPCAKMYAIDNNPVFLDIASSRIKGLRAYNGDLNNCELPKVDYFVSSLALHHMDTDQRRGQLAEIAKSSSGLVNFDFVLDDGADFDYSIELIMDFIKKNFSDKKVLQSIEDEMREYDNPMHIEEQRELFESMGMDFQILAKHSPYVVYRASWEK